MEHKKHRIHRIIALCMAFLMVFTMIPTSALAAETKVPVSLQGIHSAQVSSMKLYSYEDKESKSENLLEDVELEEAAYNLELAPGDYWVDGYDSNDDLNGGIKITVTEDGTNTFYIQRIYEMYCSNSGWIDGTDYIVSAKVVSSDSEVREITLGKGNSWGKERTTCLFVKGDTITATFTPIGEKAEKYIEGSFTKSAVTINSSISGSLNEAMELSFKVPAGSTVDVGKTIKNNYYTQEFYTPVKKAESNEDGTESWTFRISKETSNASMGPYHFYKVQNPAGVTYWNFFDASKQTETLITLTEEDLFINDENFQKDTIIKDYSENQHDTANIYMNINAQGYKSMKKGETYELNMFRNWQAIEHFYNRMIALPDMHYEIIPLEGEDVISIEADEKISSVATMTAKNEGTAIVLVTYDAMYSTQAMTDYDDSAFYNPSKFSAIWPEFTGVFVVTVDKDGTAIDAGMTIDRQGTEGMLDAEHDILFYTDDKGASYSFLPEEGTKVTVNRSVVDDTKMSFQGFTSDQVMTAEDGTVTVKGLTTGRHIIKVEKDGLANYQVITARQMSYELQDEDGNKLTEEDEIKANDIIYVQFSGLVNPCEKMAGIYNHAAIIQYLGEDASKHVSTPGGGYGVYDFSSDASEQRVKVQIPKYWTGDTYTLLSGVINMKTSGSAPASHRAVSYKIGTAANYDAVQGIGTLLCELPEIELSIAKTEFIEGTLKFEDENGKTISRDQINITLTDAEGNEVSVTDQSAFLCFAEEYFYDIKADGYMYQTGSVTVSEDTSDFTITLQSSSENAWDGSSSSEPAAEENIYQIKNAAELTWFANYVNNGNSAASAVLTDDIDLAGYPWTPIGKSAYTGTFDGNGYTVNNLYVTGKTGYLGLFASVTNGGTIKNLTVKGNILAENTAGGITGSVNNGTIEKCISYVTITTKNSMAGGIAGNAYQSVIRDCANYGVITSEANTIGGIAASATSSTTQTKITNCYNKGTITGASYVGGIVGNAGGISITACYNAGNVKGSSLTGGIAGSVSGSTSVYSGGTASIKACYNQGVVEAASKVGGIAGQAGYLTANDCYNAGAVNGETNIGSLIGALANNNVSGTNIYYLENTVSTDSALALGEAKSSEELKLAFLDEEYFAGICNGYPALLWQKDVTFHTSKESGTETKATCTTKGYTTYVCEACKESYRKEYTDAIGHDWCEHDGQDETCTDCVYTAPTCTNKGSIIHTCRHENCTETKTDILEATGHTEDPSQTVEKTDYKECICNVCGESYRVWNEERLNHMTFDYPVLTEISLTDGSYKWNYDTENHYFKNENKSVGTTAETTLTVDLAKTSKLSFDYGTLSMQSTDTFKMIIDDETVKTLTYTDGNINEYYEIVLEAGKHTVTFQYAITGFWGNSNGAAYFKDLSIQKLHEHDFGTTWKYNDTQHWKECTSCEETTELADHSFTWVVDKAATTESTGLKHEECICGIKRNEETEIPKVATVTVYFSISDDEDYVASDNTGEVMALREMTVPYFDLAAYDLEDYATGNEDEVTMLHLVIYALEVYYCGIEPEEAGKGYLNEEGYLGSDTLSVSGSAGSIFLEKFWDMDMNLNYYLNYEYPLESAGWGATADRIVLHDGDVVTLGHFASWNFYSDPTSIFNYIQNGDDTVTTSAEQGEQITLTLYHAGEDYANGNYTTEHSPIEYCPNVYYVPVDELNDLGGDPSDWYSLGTADANGNITVDTSELDAGTYLVAIAGQRGSVYTDDICSTPGAILLTVTEASHVHDYGTTWKSNATQHWKECSCSDKKDLADHTFEWVVDTEASEYITGTKHEECTICHAKRSENTEIPATHEHNYSTEWSYDVSAHWKECACSDKKDLAEHTFTWVIDQECVGVENGLKHEECSVCGFIRNENTVIEAEEKVLRLEGTDRYGTSKEIADLLKEKYGVEKFESAIVAIGRNKKEADALSGSYLSMTKNAPILLTNETQAQMENVTSYIEENVKEGATIYILGGFASLPEDLDTMLKAAGYTVQRLAGDTRYETSVKILEETGIHGDELIVATGKTCADSLSASAAGRPILLVKPGVALNDAQKAILEKVKGGTIYIAGGTSAVTEETEAELVAYGTVKRLAGKDRYETSVLIANEFFAEPELAVVANGKTAADGLCGGPLAYMLNVPMILTKDENTFNAENYLTENEISSGYVLGGISALSEETVEALFGFAEI